MEPGLIEWGGLGLNGAAVVILYAMHRDIKELSGRQDYIWRWVDRIRRHLWPQVFARK